MAIILITGGAGRIGTMLRTRLARPGRTLRLLDISAPADPAGPGEEVVLASVTDMAAMEQACAGTDAVIHLGGVSGEASWERVLETNIQGSYTVFEAARRAGGPRVIFASSNHAAGFTPRSAFPVPDYAFPAPDTYYGVSKVTGEARYGSDVAVASPVFAYLVTSTIARGRISAIDDREARAVPGVVDLLTHEHLADAIKPMKCRVSPPRDCSPATAARRTSYTRRGPSADR